MEDRPIPLCVDLDGTLVRTDMLHEAMLELLKQAPLALAGLPGWLIKGRAAVKLRIAELIEIDAAYLPYRKEVLELIDKARLEGRPVVLATAAARPIAEAVARHLGVFDIVLSSDGKMNLSAQAKAQQLVERFGEGGFDYIGNGRDDLLVWRKARNAIIVSGNERLCARAEAGGQQVQRIAEPQRRLLLWFNSLRPHQWLKNLLVFVPLFAGQKSGDAALLESAALAFAAFCLAASSVYTVNDLLDLPSDRRHHRKCTRPFASGALPLATGLITAPLLMIGALLISIALPMMFSGALLLYLLLTTAYSLKLKRQVIVDVMLLAGLYTLRIIAGSAATQISPSFWLLAFSMFIFLSLALVKRYSELILQFSEKDFAPGRGYAAADLPVLMALGASSGLISVLVLALYLNSQTVADLYREQMWLWLVPPIVLYWVLRLWMKTHRGEVHDDPVVFAARDHQSLAIMLALAVLFLAAGGGGNIIAE